MTADAWIDQKALQPTFGPAREKITTLTNNGIAHVRELDDPSLSSGRRIVLDLYDAAGDLSKTIIVGQGSVDPIIHRHGDTFTIFTSPANNPLLTRAYTYDNSGNLIYNDTLGPFYSDRLFRDDEAMSNGTYVRIEFTRETDVPTLEVARNLLHVYKPAAANFGAEAFHTESFFEIDEVRSIEELADGTLEIKYYQNNVGVWNSNFNQYDEILVQAVKIIEIGLFSNIAGTSIQVNTLKTYYLLNPDVYTLVPPLAGVELLKGSEYNSELDQQIDRFSFPDGRFITFGGQDIPITFGIDDPRSGNVVGTDNSEVLTASVDSEAPSALFGLGGDDTLYGSFKSDTINGGAGNDTIYGRVGDDILNGGDNADLIEGGIGNDTIVGSNGSDTALGGADNDRFVFSFAQINDFLQTIDGGDGFDTLEVNGGSTTSIYDLYQLDAFVARSIEALHFGINGRTGLIQVSMTDQRFAPGGFSNELSITGVVGAADGIDIRLTGATFDARQWSFQNFQDSQDYVNFAGNALANTIFGSSARDIMRGGGQNDTLSGGSGRDSVFGEAGNDVIRVRQGDLAASGETMDGGTGLDVLDLYNSLLTDFTFDLRPHTITGFETIQLSGAAARNGATFSYAQVGARTLAFDLLSSVVSSTETITVDVTGVITTNFDGLSFTNFQAADRFVIAGDGSVQTLRGTVRSDVINAGGGADILDGAAGRDEQFGEAGNDRFTITQASHAVAGEIYDGGLDSDTIAVQTGTFDFRTSTLTSIEALAYEGTGGAIIALNAGQIGSVALASNATITGDAGSAVNRLEVTMTSANAFLDLSSLAFARWGSNDVVQVFGAAGVANTVIGTNFGDAIQGSTGNDILIGGGGADFYLGGAGNDTYRFDGTDTILEVSDQGIDTIITDVSITSLMSNVENITLRAGVATALNAQGSSVANRIIGNEYGNTINGLDGDDTIDGGFGFDVLDGGTGIDTNDASFWAGGYFWNMSTGVATFGASSGSESAVNFENAITGDGDDFITGTDAANVITANDGNDLLYGFGGDDTINGGFGDDYVSGGTGIDTMDGGEGFDSVDLTFNTGRTILDTAAGTVVLLDQGGAVEIARNFESFGLGDGNDVANGSSIGESISGGGGDDTLNGGGGDDVLIGGVGVDRLFGGSENDILDIDENEAVDGEVYDGGLGTGDELRLSGSGASLVASTVTGIERINFEAGGSFDRKTLFLNMATIGTGIAQNATVVFDSFGGSRLVLEMGATSAVKLRDLIFFNEGDDDLVQIFGDLSTESIIGTRAKDEIFGEEGNDTLDGFEGNDFIDGGTGADRMTGGLGNDTFVVDNTGDLVTEAVNGGIDTVMSLLANYTLRANVENLTLASSGNARGTGNTLDNIITGNEGVNTLSGGGGNDTMIGGGANDTYVVDSSGDVVDETDGFGADAGGVRDLVNSSVSYSLTGLAGFVENLTLTGGAAINATGNELANLLTGNNAANVLTGGGGRDSLVGNAGNDRLIGGADNDLLTGGLNADTFVFERAGLTTNGIDRVADFTSGLDRLEFQAADYAGLSVGALAAARLVFGSAAAGTGAQFVYNSASGLLAWDADGAGGQASIQIATFNPGTILTTADFLIV